MTNKPGGTTANASIATTATRADREPQVSTGTANPTTTSGADTVAESADTERARVDITRPNQRLVSPADHGKLAPAHMAIANIPPGSEPTAIDPNTGRAAVEQVAKVDEKRLDKIDQS
jgi:hypothetical protein